MPRLTFANYHERYKLLRKTWEESPVIFGHLLPNEQWNLFDYFMCHEKRSEEGLKTYWGDMHVRRSSLPQRAGRAYKRFEQVLEKLQAPVASASGKGRAEYEIHVYGQVQPNIDIEGLAQVVMMLGRQLRAESRRTNDQAAACKPKRIGPY